MKFGFIGINYKKAQLDIRDKTSFTDMMKIEYFQKAESVGVEQCMVLSTCNRSEVYFLYQTSQQFAQMEQFYKDMFPSVSLEEYLVRLQEKEALAYLFRITAGLESLVLGEDQILGQVKEAADFARTMGYSKKELNKLVRDGITCAKKIKTVLKISEVPLSVSYVGIREVNRICPIRNKRILVIGSSKTSVLAMKYLYEYEAGQVTLCSRTFAHAKELEEEFPDLCVIPYEQRYEQMTDCDIVISATASPHCIVKKEKLQVKQSMVFLDLAAPRDIDVQLAENPQITLINLDTLQKMVEHNQKERERLVEESRCMIEEALEETQHWLLHSRVDSTIASLQQRCGEIVEDSYTYLNRKMDLSPREQKLMKKVLHASLQRLLREPIQELKKIESKEIQDEYQKLVKQLFQI